MRNYNNLTITVYASGTTPVADPRNQLRHAGSLEFATYYPGGLYGPASFWVERDLAEWWAVKGAQRVAFHNNGLIVYEGKIDDLEAQLRQPGQGVSVAANGFWDTVMARRKLRKYWADQRISEDVWRKASTDPAFGQEKCEVDRNQRIRFTPKAEAWTSGEFAAVLYTMPVGETVKKITWDYNFREGGQAWEMTIFNVQTSSDGWSITASGSATGQSAILATPSRMIELRFYARADQTPTSDGTYFGEFSNITMYSETGAINLTEIAKDVAGSMSELNADQTNINSNTYSLVPFIADWESMADILVRAAEFGDGSQNPWYVGLLDSESAATPNGKPVLYVEARPALTDYDLIVRVDEANLVAPFGLRRDYTNIWNWIMVQYIDERGFTQWVTPDDDSTLKDTNSITDWDQRDYPLSVGEATQAMAINYGRRFLARYKDPEIVPTQAIGIKGYIRGKGTQIIPASQVHAKLRLKIENYPDPSLGGDPILLLSATSYNDAEQVTTMSSGPAPGLTLLSFAHPEPIETLASMIAEATPERGGAGRIRWGKILKAEKLSWKAFRQLSHSERIRLRKKYPKWGGWT